MTTSSGSVAEPREESRTKQTLGIVPGLLLLAAVGYAGKFLEKTISTYGKTHHYTFPNIEYVLWPY